MTYRSAENYVVNHSTVGERYSIKVKCENCKKKQNVTLPRGVPYRTIPNTTLGGFQIKVRSVAECGLMETPYDYYAFSCYECECREL